MIRTLMQAYIRGSNQAVPFYQKAFDARLVASYLNDEDNTYYHAELNVYGQILAIAEIINNQEIITGTTMQFCLHFEESEEHLVRKAYEILKEGAIINFPLGSCDYSNLMVDLTDKFGVRWCLFI